MMLLLDMLTTTALACAGMVAESGSIATSDGQLVLLEIEGDTTVNAVFRSEFQGDAETFGWVIPVPGEVAEVADGDGEALDRLAAQTGPLVTQHEEEAPSGCARSNDLAKSGDDTGWRGDVEVELEGFTGTYDYSVLSAASTEALEDWLDADGFDIGPTSDAIDAYIASGEYRFVAIRLAHSIGSAQLEELLPPIAIRYDGPARYPAMMGLNALPESMRTTVLVSGGRFAVQGWAQTTIPALFGELGTDDPETLFETALWDETGDVAAYARTFVGEVEGVEVTRFDTWAATEVHTSDPAFTTDADADDTRVTIDLYVDGAPQGAWLLLLPLAGLGLRRRRVSGPHPEQVPSNLPGGGRV